MTAFADTLRAWRRSRRCSQLALALNADVSARHLSCLESGKAAPSRQMVLQLADALELPLRERNDLLQAAGYAPVFADPGWSAQSLQPVRDALNHLLAFQEPYPALVVNRDWQLIQANAGVYRLLQACGLDAEALSRLSDASGQLNVMRLTLHPQGLLPCIENHVAVRAHLVARSRRERAVTRRDVAWQAIADLVGDTDPEPRQPDAASLPVMPLCLRLQGVRLQLFTTLTTLGTPLDVTADELRVEAFYPLDEVTKVWFQMAANL